MDIKYYLLDKAEDADILQMVFRGIVVFLTTVIILRVSGKRTFGKGTPIDNLIVITFGGMLGRVITGAAAFMPVIMAMIVMLLVYRLLAWCSLFRGISDHIMGHRTVLYEHDEEVRKGMKKTLTSRDDLVEALRLHLNTEDFEQAEKIIMERNGEISVTRKKMP